MKSFALAATAGVADRAVDTRQVLHDRGPLLRPRQVVRARRGPIRRLRRAILPDARFRLRGQRRQGGVHVDRHARGLRTPYSPRRQATSSIRPRPGWRTPARGLHANVVKPETAREMSALTRSRPSAASSSGRGTGERTVGLYDRPAEHERTPKVFRVKAAGGERRHMAFTATPLRDLGKVKVEVADLPADMGGAGPRGRRRNPHGTVHVGGVAGGGPAPLSPPIGGVARAGRGLTAPSG